MQTVVIIMRVKYINERHGDQECDLVLTFNIIYSVKPIFKKLDLSPSRTQTWT